MNQHYRSTSKKMFNRLLLHGIIGALLGYLLLHPISVMINNLTAPEQLKSPAGIFSSFNPNHLWMAFYFALIGAFFGIVCGLDRHRNLRLYEKVKQLSNTDALTGLYNRRLLKQRLQREYERARRYDNDFSLMIIDIDYFKKFNDMHGHPAGDDLLRKFAQRMILIARKTDFVARYGGEEFVILMPDTDISMAAHLGERIRKDIETFAFEKRTTQPAGKITVSIGCARIDLKHQASADQLLKEADDQLYKAKKNGRNQIQFQPPSNDF